MRHIIGNLKWENMKKDFFFIKLEDKLVIYFTAGIFLTAAVTALIFIRQANVMEGQLEEMKGAGNQTERLVILNMGQLANAAKSAAASQIQAIAAQENVKAIQRQMRQEQRAWISIQFTQWDISPNAPISIKSTMSNSGKTPAKHIRSKIVVRKVMTSERLHLAYEGYPLSEPRGGILIPNEPITILGYISLQFQDPGHAIVPMRMTQNDVEQIKAGLAYGIIYGKIDYDDIFGKHHWIKFCGYNSGDMHQIQHAVTSCAEYNDVDNND